MIPPMVSRVASSWVGWLEDGHQHPGGKGDEELFARAVQHRQQVIQAVFLVQVQEGVAGLGLSGASSQNISRAAMPRPTAIEDEGVVES